MEEDLLCYLLTMKPRRQPPSALESMNAFLPDDDFGTNVAPDSHPHRTTNMMLPLPVPALHTSDTHSSNEDDGKITDEDSTPEDLAQKPDPLEVLRPASVARSILSNLPFHRKRPRVRTLPKQEEVDNYDMVKVRAIRSNDIGLLRSLLHDGHTMDACNRSGETLLHLACRRSNLETVHFLVHEARVKVDVQDDFGRTVLHDLCWRPHPCPEMMECLLQVVSPDLLLTEDVRGHVCFDYCRKHDWPQWTDFLRKLATFLQRRALLFREQPDQQQQQLPPSRVMEGQL